MFGLEHGREGQAGGNLICVGVKVEVLVEWVFVSLGRGRKMFLVVFWRVLGVLALELDSLFAVVWCCSFLRL